MAVGSKQSGGLNMSIISRMYQTSLTSQVSSNVQNEAQKIEISSTVVPEKYVLSFIHYLNKTKATLILY